MTKTQTPTLRQFKQWARTNAPLAKAVLLAQAHAELERERVNVYIQPILARYAFVDGLSRDSHKGSPITDTEHLYLVTDEAKVAAFFKECDAAHRAHGFAGPEGHCPALRAENLLMQAQSALIDCAKPLFGFDSTDIYGENRKKALELLLGACMKADKEAA